MKETLIWELKLIQSLNVLQMARESIRTLRIEELQFIVYCCKKKTCTYYITYISRYNLKIH